MEGGLAHSGPIADEATTLLDVLGLVLEHSDLLQRVQDFCRLLETSRAVAAAVQQVPGRLDMEIDIRTTQQAQAMVPWLARHGRSIGLLKIVTVYFGHEDSDNEDEDEEEEEEDPVVRDQRLAAAAEGQAAAEAGLLAALQQAAAAAAPGLQLRELCIFLDQAASAVQLLQLAGRQLTHLKLCPCWSSWEDEAGKALVAAAVAGLPRLQQLQLLEGTDQVLEGLSGSSSLTQLEGRCRHPSVLPGLPSQLQDLDLIMQSPHDGCALQLRHCTALTRLLISSSAPLETQDELPDSLAELHVPGGISCEPLLGLTRLRELRIYSKPPPALELRRLSQLSSLSRIKLEYLSVEMAASAQAWAVLPGLLELDLSMSAPFDSCVTVMQHLSKATRVDKLSVSVWGVEAMDAMIVVLRPLAEALSALSQLRDLNLSVDHRTRPDWEEPSPALEAGLMALAAAIAGLPSLQDLKLHELPWDLFAPPLAAAGTQLTSLSLHGGSELLDVDLSRLFCGLTGLRSLVLGRHSTDEALVVAADHLQQLTRLAVWACPALSVKGLQQLARMPRLRRFEFNIGFRREFNFSARDVRAAVAAAGGGGASLQVVVDGRQE